MSFDVLGLTPELLRAVADQGYREPTPVQRESIPLILGGRDVLAGAQTGTGKTAAFVLPVLQLLNATRTPGWQDSPEPRRGPRRDDRRQPIRALVLTPTRELCLQIEESVRTYGAHRRIRSVAIYGGVGYEPQNRALRAGPGLVVATPGRLLDHIAQGHIDLSRLEILVLDEADRMLDMGFIRDIRKVIGLLPARRQTLLFSATFSEEIRQLANGILRDPAMVQVTPRNTATELVTQVVFPVDQARKRDLLAHLVRSRRVEQALVFTRTKHGANRLAEQLARDGIAATAIHGNKSQGARVRALNDFKTGRATILVATEVASRGLDIEDLPHVVNYELPLVAEDYLHRIGRTGRAGASGDAISLVSAEEAPLLREIERLLRQRVPTETIAGFEPGRRGELRHVPEPDRRGSLDGFRRTGPQRNRPLPAAAHRRAGGVPSAAERNRLPVEVHRGAGGALSAAAERNRPLRVEVHRGAGGALSAAAHRSRPRRGHGPRAAVPLGQPGAVGIGRGPVPMPGERLARSAGGVDHRNGRG